LPPDPRARLGGAQKVKVASHGHDDGAGEAPPAVYM
jgi:hypothetical protein